VRWGGFFVERNPKRCFKSGKIACRMPTNIIGGHAVRQGGGPGEKKISVTKLVPAEWNPAEGGRFKAVRGNGHSLHLKNRTRRGRLLERPKGQRGCRGGAKNLGRLAVVGTKGIKGSSVRTLRVISPRFLLNSRGRS